MSAAASITAFAEIGIVVRPRDGRIEYRVPCPQCAKGDRDDALSVNIKRGLFHCHRCNWKGNALATPRDDMPLLEYLWSKTEALRGTVGEIYLKHRRCVLPPPDSDLRFMPATDRYPNPSLVALVTHAVTNARMTLHITKLARYGRGKAGTDRDKVLLKNHPKAGGVIRLWPNESVTLGLGTAEGIESALAAAHAYTPVWATVDAGNMAKFSVLNGIETIVIFADNDEAGLKAARACGRRWAAARRDVQLVVPAIGDINDAIRDTA